MPDVTTSWLNPKTVLQLGLGTVGTLVFIWLSAAYIPQTKVLAQDILREVGLLQDDHKAMRETLLPKLEEGNRIQCAACWNGADNQEEIRRCSCSPDR